MRDLNIKECKNITGGDFWGDLTYLAASAYYDLTCGCGGSSLDYTPEEYKAQLALY